MHAPVAHGHVVGADSLDVPRAVAVFGEVDRVTGAEVAGIASGVDVFSAGADGNLAIGTVNRASQLQAPTVEYEIVVGAAVAELHLAADDQRAAGERHRFVHGVGAVECNSAGADLVEAAGSADRLIDD